MKIIQIEALKNGAHRNQEGEFTDIPDGYAIIPDDMPIPDTFPFVDIEVTENIEYEEVTELQDVIKTREVPVFDENGECVLDEAGNIVTTQEEYTEQEMVTYTISYTVYVVTSMTAGVVPEVKPVVETPTEITTEDMAKAILEGVNEI